MKIEIRSWYTGGVLFAAEVGSLKLAVELAVKRGADLGGANLRDADLWVANLRGVNLGGANLRGANLGGADLGDANLRDADLWVADLGGANLGGADLRGADLRVANLRDADLWVADLRGANLRGANLRDANLRGANLRDANLRGADLGGAKNATTCRLDTGETLAEYIAEVVPALCMAGGKPLAEVAAAWDCHAWDNCPMAVAFGVHSLAEVPALYRPRADQFVRLFDAKLLPNPMDGAAA